MDAELAQLQLKLEEAMAQLKVIINIAAPNEIVWEGPKDFTNPGVGKTIQLKATDKRGFALKFSVVDNAVFSLTEAGLMTFKTYAPLAIEVVVTDGQAE